MSQLLPGAIIGIIGGDEQVASIAREARKMGYVVYCYHQSNEAAISMAEYEIVSSYKDREALLDFAEKVDTVLLLTNLVPVDVLYEISSKTRYYQSFELAEISQNRTVEKLFLDTHAINLAPYSLVTTVGELPSIVQSIGLPELKECTFRVACDVTNPLCGPMGSSAIYGPQKGATPEMVKELDEALLHYAELSKETFDHADRLYPGTGAAGGMGFAFLTYTNAVLESGIKIVLEETGLEEEMKDADFVITGEGRLDSQTALGKAPIGVAHLAKKHGKKVLAFAGCLTPDAGVCNENGIDAFFPILRRVITVQEAMEKEIARENMIRSVEQVFRLIKAVQ